MSLTGIHCFVAHNLSLMQALTGAIWPQLCSCHVLNEGCGHQQVVLACHIKASLEGLCEYIVFRCLTHCIHAWPPVEQGLQKFMEATQSASAFKGMQQICNAIDATDLP